MLISSGWTHRKTFSMPVLRALSSETNTNSEIASSYRWYPTLPRREKIAGGVLGYKDLKKKEEKMLMISSGDPIGVQRGLAEQTWAWEAVCHKEELHRVQRQESQGDWDFLYRYRTLCHHNVKSKRKRHCVRKTADSYEWWWWWWGVTKQYVTWKYYIRDGEKKSGPPMAPDISDNRYLFVTKSNRLKARLAMDAIAHL